jgi:hypothetical protein
MPRYRRKLSAPLKHLHIELDRLIRYDANNQKLFSGARRSGMSLHQLHMNVESSFNTAFRCYENFIRDIFMLYCQEKVPKSGQAVHSYLRPKDFLHAEAMIKSSMPFLDWSNPDIVIQRAELYLKDGAPVKIPYSAHRETLQDMKSIRNHIAHNSEESLEKFKKVIKKHYTVYPLEMPRPGKFLLEPDRKTPSNYKLLVYLEFLKQISSDLT